MASLAVFVLLISALASAAPHRSGASSAAPRKLAELVTTPVIPMSYHRGYLVTGTVPVNIVFYGKFPSSHRAVIADFISSLSSPSSTSGKTKKKNQAPTVAAWWEFLGEYYSISKAKLPILTLGLQIHDESLSLGKSLNDADIAALAARASAKSRSDSVSVVLTAANVAVEEFCVSRCGEHWSSPAPARKSAAGAGRHPFLWVGNPASQCPGQCAWPFSKPEFGPQTAPLVPPSGDAGVDGMVINLAAMLAGVATNPFGNGFYQGAAEAPMEAASACSGVYGRGSYPGYPGKLLVDPTTGASYNAVGGGPAASGRRKFLLPAIFDPSTSLCSTLV